MRTEQQTTKRPRRTHIFERDENDRYIEPRWCSARLFQAEFFQGAIHDPCAGTGQILKAARTCKLEVTGADIAPCVAGIRKIDFLTDQKTRPNTVFNPPYDWMREFAEHALELTERKVAMLVPSARIHAAHHWLERTPLRRIWFLTPRPSIPPHSYLLAGHKPQGGRVDFCWVVWERNYSGAPQWWWLHRDVQR